MREERLVVLAEQCLAGRPAADLWRASRSMEKVAKNAYRFYATRPHPIGDISHASRISARKEAVAVRVKAIKASRCALDVAALLSRGRLEGKGGGLLFLLAYRSLLRSSELLAQVADMMQADVRELSCMSPAGLPPSNIYKLNGWWRSAMNAMADIFSLH